MPVGYDSDLMIQGGRMTNEPTDTVAIMAAIIYAIRMAGQGPTDKAFQKIAQEAWDLHKAVASGGEPRTGRAGF